jgi:hypothetical protein
VRVSVLRPKQPLNLKITGVVCGAFLLTYAIGSQLAPWNPKRGLGLGFGVLAAVVLGFEMLYAARGPAAWPLASARHWLQAHVYLGAAFFVAVLVHAGLRWPEGFLGWWLLILSAATTGTGLLGVWLQKWIPASLAEGLRVEAVFERIPDLVLELREEADRLTAGASDVLERFYRNEVRGALSSVQPSWSYLLDVRRGRERALEPFRRMAQFVDEAEQGRVLDLMALFTEKLELDAQYSLQRVLRGWLVLHVPVAGLLMGLVATHIVGWLWY